MNWSFKTVNQIEIKWSPYWFLILVNSGFRNINFAANIPLLFTSCSRISKCLLLIVQCEARYKISVKAGKGVFHMIPGHVLEKNVRNLYTFFSFLFQQKIRPHGRLYGRLCRTRILCSTLIWAALLLVLFPAVPTKTMVHAVALTVFLPFLVKDPFV